MAVAGPGYLLALTLGAQAASAGDSWAPYVRQFPCECLGALNFQLSCPQMVGDEQKVAVGAL